MSADVTALSDFEREILEVLADEQARFERGDWNVDSTVWSRVGFRIATLRNKTLPSPVPKKVNMDRALATQFTKAVKHLSSLGLLRFRSIGAGKDSSVRGGYNLHQLRDKDIVLTDAGRALIASWQPKPIAGPTVEWVYLPPKPKKKPKNKPTAPWLSYTITVAQP